MSLGDLLLVWSELCWHAAAAAAAVVAGSAVSAVGLVSVVQPAADNHQCPMSRV